MRARTLLLTGLLAACAAAPARAAAAASPYQAGAPWPVMRHDERNTGRSDLVGRYDGRRPWSFRTGKGIFSTPVVARDGTVYVGSADRRLYALTARGRKRWSFTTGGIIDAGAALGPRSVTIGSGDETLYSLALDGPSVRWRFRPTVALATGQLVDWWEGNVALGPGGGVYAGNTGGAAYALTAAGVQRWAHPTGNSVWTTPAFDGAGNSYWGSLDLSVFKLDRAGRQVWKTGTLGYVVSSPAIGRDGTIYVASFDRRLYALDPATGRVKWTFVTGEHIYSSPALGADGSVYVASTDGSVYALTAAGRLRWRFQTGEPVRSSPVIGRSVDGGEVVYVGSGNGTLYALEADSGRRRWSFDTTPASGPLRDRNDLNGSPALARDGVVLGGEHGFVWKVPYDYCLRKQDPRCSTDTGEELTGPPGATVLPVSAGGSTVTDATVPVVSPATVLTGRLIVRRDGRAVPARLQPGASLLRAPFGATTELSGDGQDVFAIPDGFLPAGRTVSVPVDATYAVGVAPLGRTGAPARAAGTVRATLKVRTLPKAGPLPLRVAGDRVSALRIRRLAIPLPSFVTSVNQIGFDSYDLLAGTVSVGAGRVLLWVVGLQPDGGVDVGRSFAFPLDGRTSGADVILSARDLALRFSFGDVPMRRFELRGRLRGDLAMEPGAALLGEVTCADVPNYGAALQFVGLCNATDTLTASGTFLTDRYAGSAARRPAGATAGPAVLTPPTAGADGSVTASVTGLTGRHLLSILLTDAATGSPLPLDLRALTSQDAGGGVRVRLPAGTVLPSRVRATVISDVFALGHTDLTG